MDLDAPSGRDRTSEASTSSQPPSSGQAPSKKKVRPPPVPVKPPRLDPVILQNGVLLIDKPLEWTSFDVCAKVRNSISKSIGVRKVGHAGTLDPMASGLLIVCTGTGTKSIDEFVAQDKVYSGTLRLGEITPSYDAEMEVSETAPWQHISDAELAAAAASFVGSSMQVPPMFSAIKVAGKKMYDLAREGQSIDLPPRPITISHFTVARDGGDPQLVHFEVGCSKGTYIRALARDYGAALGSLAYLRALRREAIGGYSVAGAWQMDALIPELARVKEEGNAAKAAAEAAAKAAAKAAAAGAVEAAAAAQPQA